VQWAHKVRRSYNAGLRGYSVSPYRHGAFDRSVKKNMPGKLFFVFAKEGVPLVRTYVLCTRRRRNISLIEDLVR